MHIFKEIVEKEYSWIMLGTSFPSQKQLEELHLGEHFDLLFLANGKC